MSEATKHPRIGAAAAGACAGTVNGLLGGAGGIILVPGLRCLAKVPEDRIFPTSVAVMLPTTVLSLLLTGCSTALPVARALPYLAGSTVGGVLAGLWGSRVPVLWLHRLFGAVLLAGGLHRLGTVLL